MAKFSLNPFDPHSKHITEFQLQSEVNTSSDQIFISFCLTGMIGEVDFGDNSPLKSRKLNLWEKTCFEFFIKNKSGHYLEFNFSPVFEWNIFYFEKLRGPLKEYETMENIEFDILNSADKFKLIASFNKKLLPENFLDLTELSFGITTVIKMKNTDIEYWALKHADSKPNFHHYDSFIGKF